MESACEKHTIRISVVDLGGWVRVKFRLPSLDLGLRSVHRCLRGFDIRVRVRVSSRGAHFD